MLKFNETENNKQKNKYFPTNRFYYPRNEHKAKK